MASFIRSRNIERVFLLSLGAALLYLFLQLFAVLENDFKEVPRRLGDGSMINLNNPNTADNLAALLQKGFYFEDRRDIELIRSVAAKGFSNFEEIDNIGELNKKAFEITTEEAYAKGGESFRKRAKLSRALIGFNGNDSLRFDAEKKAPPPLPASVDVALGQHTISGRVQTKEEAPLAGVLVRLQMIIPQDSLYSESVQDEGQTVQQNTPTLHKTFRIDSFNKRQLVSLAAYARTNGEGKFAFKGLPDNKAYELIPLQPGYQFGSSQGLEELNEDRSFSFTQSPHTIRLFSTHDFNNLRKEKALIVRTPDEVAKWYWAIVIVFFASFLVLHFFL
ncbi:MAG TPA: cell cycle protein, partial [Flavisolibacter sp.]